MLTINQLTHAYNGRIVLSVDNLTISEGEIVAIMGPSGAGKSTLLRLMAFLERPTHGTISLHHNHKKMSQPDLMMRRDIAVVFQRPALLRRSVRANIEYGLRVRGRSNPALVTHLIGQLGLSAHSDAPITTLSGGELQRVALARALATEPRLLLLDEPTAHLDPANVRLIEAMVQEANCEHGTTIVVVTHNLFQARRLSQRTALILDGNLVEIAPTVSFFERPSLDAAAFLNGTFVY